jgi:general secretion pathway protein G
MLLHKQPSASALRRTQLAVARAAFTLMEMLMVVAIIVALAGLGAFAILPQFKQSQAKIAKTKIDGALMTAVRAFELNNNRPPSSLEELLQAQNGGPYLESRDALKDPWGREFQYMPESTNPQTNARSPKIYTTDPSTNLEISNFASQ